MSEWADTARDAAEARVDLNGERAAHEATRRNMQRTIDRLTDCVDRQSVQLGQCARAAIIRRRWVVFVLWLACLAIGVWGVIS